MSVHTLLPRLGCEIEDAEEEAFLLFAQTFPSQNLGMVDAKATTLDVSVGARDFTIHQSPTILASLREGGTTGAVLWKVTPRLAAWLSAPGNVLRDNGFLGGDTTIVELGCGISGLLALSLSPRVGRYILTDQPYVLRLLQQNLRENAAVPSSSSNHTSARGRRSRPVPTTNAAAALAAGNIVTQPLDWECELPDLAITATPTIVLACDCIYNDALIAPFTQTCAQICRRAAAVDADATAPSVVAPPPLAVIAQQLRSPDVFEEWLRDFSRPFRVWRVPDTLLPPGLQAADGFAVHVGVLRGTELGEPGTAV